MSPKPVILSLEQATALPYATLRFVHLGWRVIRIEAPAADGDGQPGDPNRYVGRRVDGEDRRSLFVAPNVGKEALALNLKSERGRALLRELIVRLGADVFCCNVLPARYRTLGIDYDTLSAAKPDLIWAGISAMGPDYPDRAGYDPVIQAMSGLMDLNGFADGPPTLLGLPITDLKAGDEVYANVLLALFERQATGKGRRIDVSMLQAAASWLIAVLPLLDLGGEPAELTRTGNAHRRFVPTSVYATRDGFLYLALGSNAQWERLVAIPRFAALRRPDWATAEGRFQARAEVLRAAAEAACTATTAELGAELSAAKLPFTSINDLATARALPAVASRLNTTVLGGATIRLQPAAVDLDGLPARLPPPPRFGEHTRPILREVGLPDGDIDALYADGIVA